MTISADVRAAWAPLWSDVDEPVLLEELGTSGLIEADIDDLYHDGKVNFFQCITKSREQIGITQQTFLRVTVTVSYYKEIATNVNSFNDVIDRLEELRDLVRDSLGTDWNGSIEYYQLQDAEPAIDEVQLGSIRMWRGTEQYIGNVTR